MLKPEPFRTIRERRLVTVQDIKQAVSNFEEGLTTEWEYLQSIVFTATNRLNVMGGEAGRRKE
jgi:hypothetical protein